MVPGPKSKAKPVLLSVVEELGIGFVAGVASRAISTPLSVITVRIQTATEGDDEQGQMNAEKGEIYKPKKEEVVNPMTVLKQIYGEQGLRGFWGGEYSVSSRLVLRHDHAHLTGFTTAIPLSFNPAFTLFLFQIFRRMIARGKQGSANTMNPTPQEAFFGAAFSNSIATVILYPLMLAKTRLQVHRREASESGSTESESILSIWRKAYEREGWAGIYQGLEAQILKGFVNQGVTMMVKQRYALKYVLSLRSRANAVQGRDGNRGLVSSSTAALSVTASLCIHIHLYHVAFLGIRLRAEEENSIVEDFNVDGAKK